jgi:cell division protein ZapA (FtsZ GTPase activity inhibitor)
MADNLLSVQLLGTSFSLKSTENLDYLKEVVAYYEEKVDETRRGVSLQDPLKIALLTGIVLADELIKERSRHSGSLSAPEADEAERITKALIDKIDSILQ